MTERGRTARNRLCSARRAGAPPGGARAPSRGRSEVTGPCPAPPGPGDPSQRPTVGQATSQPPGGRFLVNRWASSLWFRCSGVWWSVLSPLASRLPQVSWRKRAGRRPAGTCGPGAGRRPRPPRSPRPRGGEGGGSHRGGVFGARPERGSGRAGAFPGSETRRCPGDLGR